MALAKEETAEILSTYKQSQNDTASPQVQIALLTKRLAQLNEHFKAHGKDNHSRYGLLKLVGQRKRLLRYLHRKDAAAYQQLIQKLGIRK